MKGKTVIAAIAASMAFATPAAASPAQHYETNYCDAHSFGTDCVEVRGVLHSKETPSGNLKVNRNYRFGITWEGAARYEGCVSAYQIKGHTFELQKSGETHVSHVNSKVRSSFDCQGRSYECDSKSQYTYANGELRRDRTVENCQPTA